MFQNRGGGNCGPPPVQEWEISLTKSPNAASTTRMLSTKLGGVEGSAWLTQDLPGMAPRPDTITPVPPLIPQDTDELGRQDVVQQVDDPRNVFPVGIRYRARPYRDVLGIGCGPSRARTRSSSCPAVPMDAGAVPSPLCRGSRRTASQHWRMSRCIP